jgi:tRNA (cmo5U34)-methyltransferase
MLDSNPLMLQKDTIFKSKQDKIKEFEFNGEVASVFDDMVSRSIPFYGEIHKIILDILSKTFKDGDVIYDLGCSTGNSLLIVNRFLEGKNFKLVGIDNSPSMLSICEKKLLENGVKNYELKLSGLENIEFETSGFNIMNYTLQFINPLNRLELLQKIYKSLRPEGVFILSEKIKVENKEIDDLFTDLYYDFKRRNGYSELEISQKREALEKVLNPLTPNSQIELLKMAGFKKVETLFRWYNFACYIGIK